MNDHEQTPAAPDPILISRVMELLPHRYPFLLVDRVLEIEDAKRCVALKNVSINEPFFQGHFPGLPIMPGVLVVEAMAQTGAVLLGYRASTADKLTLLTGVDGAKFRLPVVPGDQLRIEVVVQQWRSRMVKLVGTVHVGAKLVCEATLSCSVVDRQPGQAGKNSTASIRAGVDADAELVPVAAG